jgi:hypothetical protein
MRSAVARLSLVCLSSIVFGLIFTGQGSAKIDPKALAGLWYFNEGKGNVAKDSSGKGNNGKVVGNPEWVNGKNGKALQLSGQGGLGCFTRSLGQCIS